MAEADPERGTEQPTINNYYLQGENKINISGSNIQHMDVKGTFGESNGDNTDTTVINLSADISFDSGKLLHSGKKVFLGYQNQATGEDRKLAIKFLSDTKDHRKEIKILLKLDHPHIVKVISSAKCSGVPPQMYIAMELCLQNFSQYIDISPPNLPKALSFIRQIVLAIVYIHSKKIFHRDLKPSNILISMDRNSIKVSDFGISKEMPGDPSKIPVTNRNAGTDGFKAPETYSEDLKKGEKSQLTHRSDIFPLGICVYFIITHGKHPFGTNSYDWVHNIVHNVKPDLFQIPVFPAPIADKRNQLKTLLSGMLRYQPSDRPSAVDVQRNEFFKDLDQTVEYMAASSARPSSTEAEQDSNIQESQRQGKREGTVTEKAKIYDRNVRKQQGASKTTRPGLRERMVVDTTATKSLEDNLISATTATDATTNREYVDGSQPTQSENSPLNPEYDQSPNRRVTDFEDEDKPCTSASPCQKGSESAPPTINVNVTVARDIGGDLNQKSTGRTEDYRSAAIQNLNKGRLEIINEDCKTSVVANSHPTEYVDGSQPTQSENSPLNPEYDQSPNRRVTDFEGLRERKKVDTTATKSLEDNLISAPTATDATTNRDFQLMIALSVLWFMFAFIFWLR